MQENSARRCVAGFLGFFGHSGALESQPDGPCCTTESTTHTYCYYWLVPPASRNAEGELRRVREARALRQLTRAAAALSIET